MAETISTPALVPISPPMAPVSADSATTSTAMCLGAAPTERRRPISARRWMTDSSVVLAIARTPTPSAISAIASSSEVSEELTDCRS